MKVRTYLLFAALACTAPSAPSAILFTTWDNADLPNDVATGSVGGIAVTLAGTGTTPGDISFLAEDSSGFNFGFFSPPVATADGLQLTAQPGVVSEFTLTFGAPIQNPILHLASLASIVTFTSGLSTVTRLTGTTDDPNFLVSGLTVTGAIFDPPVPSGFNDANGTIRLDGTISSVTFNLTPAGNFIDGTGIQIGIDSAVVPLPGSLALLATGLSGLLWRSRPRHRLST